MPVDYSKWDALELSDDSDIEVHPNVDKRSFIRAKQAQIHQDRARRKHQIITLKYERIINDGLLSRIDRLLTALKSHKTDSTSDANSLVLQSLMESAGDPKDDRPPPPPEGVHQNTEQPPYSKMMVALIDQVKKEVDKSESEDRLTAFITEIHGHKSKVEGLNKDLMMKLAELEKEEKRHITSDDIHTGFDVSHVQKKEPETKPAVSSKPATEVELLNPGTSKDDSIQPSSGAEADVEDGGIDDPDSIKASKAALAFAQIPFGDYRASLQFVSANPSILTESDSDGLLIEAFNAQLDGKEKYGKQCVHQALLIQYCRQLGGRDGVALFFKRITTKDHQANKLFTDDVHSTYKKIKTRAAEINREKAEEGAGVEQIQLHAVDPNTTINIRVPPPIDTSAEANPASEEEVESRGIFESFPPNLQKALELGSLDEVNRVLGKMSVDEAEEVVAKLSEGGILSVEEGVVDATTEEGQRFVQEIERTGQLPGVSEEPPVD